MSGRDRGRLRKGKKRGVAALEVRTIGGSNASGPRTWLCEPDWLIVAVCVAAPDGDWLWEFVNDAVPEGDYECDGG